ncbi:hypothetical protein PtrSN002B_007625 [Pyrenophora tritici-repentis]|uniref:Uncharacterized protein n=3 Tax=Pyrenophora tritici-repentis TaxID=45151 RepID=A0A317BF75_9PLEO|nr:uncharacterized protein PTRG_01801 [Pyrenophora tritici-repentis Pt-1C-BFP]KAF7454929.1 hypothetical protein A1F99_021870 [Pyrenophora tritici-repentis]EDU41239.1 predicted protein [Pyrenophora tritici-repentis Pt-1C-BFP]KAG9388688.1 hypothetical protein A1F94_001581 [Pyrenophora tritici-repentis]KAI1518202.1 hypothetical protein Ptr86124_003503 [Pyrenophora tritici-repentis]KAI1531854.1 hypothetical protein PtrSN001A_007529 [Pyrenophora tritici-repentis]
MSYYNVYPNPTIDYVVCSDCDAATFAWLADVFPCVECGSENFELPESTLAAEDNKETEDGARKRKRSEKDDRHRGGKHG